MLILLIFINTFFQHPRHTISVDLISEKTDSLRIIYNGFATEYQAIVQGKNLLTFTVQNVESVESINSLSLNFKQLNKMNSISIFNMLFRFGSDTVKFNGNELYQNFNSNYFVTKFRHEKFLKVITNRYWNREAILSLNGSLQKLKMNTRNHYYFKIIGNPKRGVFVALYYSVGDKNYSISKAFRRDSLSFEFYSDEKLNSFQLFLGDYKNEITIQKIIMSENGNLSNYVDSLILKKFGFNLYIKPTIDNKEVVLNIETYKGQTQPLLTYRREKNIINKPQLLSTYYIDLFGSIKNSDDILKFEVLSNTHVLLSKRNLIKNDSLRNIHLQYKVTTSDPVTGVEIILDNKENSYFIDSILIISEGKKRVFTSDFIRNKFIKRNLEFNDSNEIVHTASNTNYASLYYNTDFIFFQDKVKYILLFIMFFSIAIIILFIANKSIFKVKI